MSIVVEDYHKIYGKMSAVSGISFVVRPGEILGLVGPNGAGKTTTLRALAGILTPTSGRLLIDGCDLALDPIAAKSALAYVPDDPSLFDNLTVWEHLRFVASAYRLAAGWERAGEELLAKFELVEKRDEPTAALSRGMRQKVAICCGYLHDPRVILLDEPLTGLDPRGIRTMQDSVRERAGRGASVIVSSHLLSLVENLCDSVLLIHRGRILLRGTLAELRAEAEASGRRETLEDLFFRLTESPDESPDEANSSTPTPRGEEHSA
ncbi:MAG: ABC transporter ATP-binding protein [Isosphaeraceae bacterium]|nr:ABC transporter ATP-binding protein [Isosphaeraceae bacterium]